MNIFMLVGSRRIQQRKVESYVGLLLRNTRDLSVILLSCLIYQHLVIIILQNRICM